MTKKASTPARKKLIDVSSLSVCNDKPNPSFTDSNRGNKYASLFAKLAFGKCIRCHSGDARAVVKALDAWAKRNSVKCSIILDRNYPDDGGMHGRVWMMPPKQDTTQPKTVWQEVKK